MGDLNTSRVSAVSYASDLLKQQKEGFDSNCNQMIDLLDLVLTKMNGYPEEAVRILEELRAQLAELSLSVNKAPCGKAYPSCCSKSVGWVYSLLGAVVGGLVGAIIAVVIIFLFFI